MRNFKGNKKGFTLAEMALTAAMVGIMGAAAATAQTETAADARQVMLESLADILSSASQMNQNDMNDDNTSGSNILKCEDIRVLVEGGVLPGTYAFHVDADTAGFATHPVPDGTTTECIISTTTSPRQDAPFIAFGIANGDPSLNVADPVPAA
jgi:prepilin-type N-terminal cleavage/methylation domain-containing protein